MTSADDTFRDRSDSPDDAKPLPYLQVCERCGKQFRSKYPRKFCTSACSGASLRKGSLKNCEVCGAEFYVQMSLANMKYCSHRCYWKSKEGKTTMTVEERFLKIVRKTSDCWLWTGATAGSSGYGAFNRYPARKDPRRGPELAHRVSYELFVGPIPEGHFVLHKCDVRCCVRPDHLFTGTAMDNVHDMVKKDRMTPVRGEDKHSAKLTERDVREIRVRHQSGDTAKLLAEHFHVSTGAIYSIIHGRRWGHVS